MPTAQAGKGVAMAKQNPTPQKPTEPAPLCLALRPKDAAKALGIGERLLWSKTNAGEIPHFKLGNATLYPVEALREWLRQEAAKRARR